MRDITSAILARKKQFRYKNFFTKKIITSLTIATGVAGILLTSLASASGTVNWTGQGTTNGVLNTSECDAQNDPNGLNGSYLLWVFTLGGGSNTVTNATLTVNNTNTYGPNTPSGGNIKFTTPYFDLSALTASVSYTGDLGTGDSNLVISHGCVGGSSVTTTTLKDSSNSAVAEGASVPLGSVIHDTATVTLTPSAVPTGSVTFRFYGTVADCTADTAFTGGTTKGVVALNGGNPGVADPSDATTALAPGTYAFKASWPGQNGYIGSISSCETFTVTKAQLGVNTTVHSDSPDQALVGNLSLGQGAHDSATVTGGVTGFALPNVTFYFFDNGVACTNGNTTGGTALNTLAPNGSGVVHPSTSETNLAAGTYNFMAVVAGDTNYLGSTSNCEPFTVNKAPLTVTTNIHNASHQTVTSVVAGTVVHDTATVGGGVSGFATPAVTFTFYTNGTCTPDGTNVANTGADSSAVRSADSAPLTVGSYSYKASVAENANYLGNNSDCEPLTVTLPLWCSPGFWATAISQNRTGVLTYLANHGVVLSTKYSVAKAAVNGAALSKKAPAGDPTISQVLLNPSVYGGPAFNTVADYIAHVLGWGGTQFTGENCQLDAHGNLLTTTTLTI